MNRTAHYKSGRIRQNNEQAIVRRWIDPGKMALVDPATLIFMIWSSTQQYADYAVQTQSVYGPKPTDADFDEIANNLSAIILKGCGLKP